MDILEVTTARHPDAFAIDDGTGALTYTELMAAVAVEADALRLRGVSAGDRVGIRLPSGSAQLYVAILAVLSVGASYVPVDADDPEERAALVFREAQVTTVLGMDPVPAPPGRTRRPGPEDDAWVIFTSGSTGVPKGVAVTHRAAAAFVDAEARLFLPAEPLGPEDRVLAGLSVAFDASCEEMWLAWRSGACLVPAPRSLVRSGMDLGPWLIDKDITVVSTVPTLAALWPTEALDAVRLLIFGGEACPQELVERLVGPGREVWNTYGPTEATVVACAARLDGDGPVRIGLPLDGWDLAVVDAEGQPAHEGELVIGGVGLGRYLDHARDAERFGPLPALGWDRAYRSGDLVRYEPAGLVFVGRADDQVKLGGRRIELGEVEAALQALPGVTAAAAAVQVTSGGNSVLAGYLVPARSPLDLQAARDRLREVLPAPMVPVLAEVDALPTRISGKVDRDALPWPLSVDVAEQLSGTAAWVAEQWADVLGGPVTIDDDFFSHGGGSLAAAQLVAALRARFPQVTVADVYASPRLGALADLLDAFDPVEREARRSVRPVPRGSQAVQLLALLPLAGVGGIRWAAWLAVLLEVLSRAGVDVPTFAPAWVLAAVVVLLPPVRLAFAAAGARVLLRGVRPGSHPRGGAVHLRLWAAEHLVEAVGATSLACAPWLPLFARLLGVRVGASVDLHTLPPVTGLLELGDGCSIEPEVDLSGHWLDGDVLHLGAMRVGAGARVATRSMLLPGAVVGDNATLLAGSALMAKVPPGQVWAGSPARKVGKGRLRWPDDLAPRPSRWIVPYVGAGLLLGGLPLLSLLVGALAVVPWLRGSTGTALAGRALVAAPAVTVVSFLGYALICLLVTRLLAIGLMSGCSPVRSRVGWQVWCTQRLLDEARTWLFPLYSSLLTPVWLRSLGARVGRRVEASTVLLLPSLTTVGEGAFLADDTMIGAYELHGGWLRVERTKIGKRAFLGNSGMTAPGRRVPKNGLVAVLSAAPSKSKAGSSWLGSPPVRLRRIEQSADESRTFAPPRRLVLGRACLEALRVVPASLTVLLLSGVVVAGAAGLERYGATAVLLLAGPGLLAAGAAAAGVTVAAKWLLMGRFRPGRHPLWSAHVWRGELADTFVEVLAAPWFTGWAAGTVLLPAWLRGLGVQAGRGVWCATYWLPEPDLVQLGDGCTVERGVVLQTHLFHDRVLSTDRVTIGAGATVGPHGVVLPAAGVGDQATVGPSSLVMRGDRLPPATRWLGNPVAPWHAR